MRNEKEISWAVITVMVCLSSSLSLAQSAAAQDGESESRLREALRNAIGQTRALEDERAKLLARAQSTQKKTKN
jgi:hypothetical protein